MEMVKYLGKINKKIEYSNQYPVDYFAVNIEIMKTATIWYPPINSKWQPNMKYTTFSVFTFVFCVIFCTPSEFISLWTTQTDINSFTMNIGVALTHAVATFKVLNWFIRRHRILNIMATLDGNQYHYESFHGFIPGNIVEDAKKINVTLSTVFFWCSIMVPISGYVVGFLNFFTNETNATDLTFSCTYLPFYSWIPFDHSKPLTCTLAMIFQSFPMLYLTLMIVAVDTLFMSLTNYMTAHVKILQGAFRTLRERTIAKLSKFTNNNPNSNIINKFVLIEMKKCLKHLQTIQQLCKEVEHVYSLQMLCQVLVSLFVLCTCLFLISTEPPTSKTFLVEVFYIFAIEYQLTLYCWFGNELTLASAGIVDALYESDWLNFDSATKRCMMITMIRMRKPLYVTVGKFTPLTLDTLQAIVRGSYSLYAVLKNRNA